MSDLILTDEIWKWLESTKFNPPFNEEEMFRLTDSITNLKTVIPSLPPYESFSELVGDYYLENLDKMGFSDPTADEIDKIRYCVRNYNEFSKALTSLTEINQLIQSRTGEAFPFQIERIKGLLDGLVVKILQLTTSNTSNVTTKDINFITVHSIPGIVNEYGNVEKALMFHNKLVTRIGRGIFHMDNIQRLIDMYYGENYMILHEVFYNAFQIEDYLYKKDIEQNKPHDTNVLLWLLEALETIRNKMETLEKEFHDTVTAVLETLGPLPSMD
jgi:hypothetical protein